MPSYDRRGMLTMSFLSSGTVPHVNSMSKHVSMTSKDVLMCLMMSKDVLMCLMMSKMSRPVLKMWYLCPPNLEPLSL